MCRAADPPLWTFECEGFAHFLPVAEGRGGLQAPRSYAARNTYREHHTPLRVLLRSQVCTMHTFNSIENPYTDHEEAEGQWGTQQTDHEEAKGQWGTLQTGWILVWTYRVG